MKKIVVITLTFCFFAAGAMAAEEKTSSAVPDLLQDDVFLEDDYDAQDDALVISDPLEPMNRAFFSFNDRLYFWVLKPVKTGYSYVVPRDIRDCVGNFFRNLAAPIRLVNALLQGRFSDAGGVVSRFVINSTLGVYGFADVAKIEFDIQPQRADFGQTMGFYGIGEGIYICWPILGPATVRSTTGRLGEAFFYPVSYLDLTWSQTIVAYGYDKLNTLSLSGDIYEDFTKYSLDPYVAARQAFYDYRRNLVKKAQGQENNFIDEP